MPRTTRNALGASFGQLVLDFLAEFWRELSGLTLALLGLLTLAGLVTPATSVLTDWHRFAALLFGWTVIPAALLLVAIGVALIAGRFHKQLAPNGPQILGCELILFTLAGMLHLLAPGASPQAIAQAGRGGGYLSLIHI